MKAWLRRRLIELAYADGGAPEWWLCRIARSAFADPWPDEIERAASLVVNEIEWPWFKPPALVSIDDRAIQFTGEWPRVDDLLAFRPWNRRKP